MAPDPTRGHRRRLLRLQAERVRRTTQRSLRAFVEQYWPVLEPGTPFVPGPHLDLLCEYLEAVTAGEIQQLLINLPPRHGKSIITSVMWPVWEWLTVPTRRFLCVSHSDTLARKHSLDRRRLLESPEFQRAWGDRIRLTSDQRAKDEFHNTARGAMVAISMGGSITGKGGSRLIIDDPQSPDQAEHALAREQTAKLFRGTLFSRLDDKRRDAVVVVTQRLHTHDLSAVCLEHGFTHVCVPAIAPRATTVVFPRSHRTWARQDGEALWPAREDREVLDAQHRRMGPSAFEAQYQQQPRPAEGALLRPEWWKYVDVLPPLDAYDRVYQSWDLSFKDAPTSDYVVGLQLGCIGAQVYVLDRVKDRLSFTKTVEAIRRLYGQYQRTSVLLIEEHANGSAIVNHLSGEIAGVTAVRPEGGKTARARVCESRLAAGQVFLPRPRLSDGTRIPERAWVEDFTDVCEAFPNGRHDDDVDALSQALVWLDKHPWVEPASAVRLPEPPLASRLSGRSPDVEGALARWRAARDTHGWRPTL